MNPEDIMVKDRILTGRFSAFVLLIAVAALGHANSASAICGSSPTYCQSQSQYSHGLGLYHYSDYATPDLTGADQIYLGTYGGYLGACVNGEFYKVWDEYTDSWAAQLNQDSFLCIGNGDDWIFVARTSNTVTCEGFTLGAFAYNGHALQLFGQAGDDTMIGGTGRDDLCGGSGRDDLASYTGNDRLDGHDGGDRVNGNGNSDYSWGDYYGGNTGSGGRDAVYDSGNGDATADVLYGGEDSDCLQAVSTPRYIYCGDGYDYTTHYGESLVYDCEADRTTYSCYWYDGWS